MTQHTCENNIDRWFDEESDGLDQAKVDESLARPEGRAYAEQLRQLREGVQQVSETPEIADAQFPAFMDGIREQLEAPRRGHGRLWASLSICAAGLIVAFSAFVVYNNTGSHKGPPVVEAASVLVEEMKTGIDGATVESFSGEHGTAVVWVSDSSGDVQ